MYRNFEGLPDGSAGKGSACNAGDLRDAGLTPGSRGSPGGASGNPLQNIFLVNPMDRGAWWATVHRVTKELDRTEHAIYTNTSHISIYIINT